MGPWALNTETERSGMAVQVEREKGWVDDFLPLSFGTEVENGS